MTEAGAPTRRPRRRWLVWAGRFALIAASALVADQVYGWLLPRVASDPFFRQSLGAIYTQEHLNAHRPFLEAGWDRADPNASVAYVGIFGGSVARGFARYILNIVETHRLPQADALARRFGRPVRFLDLGVNGGYDPAQFNLLHLSAHHLSAAIFLDGFNEQFNFAPGCDELATFWARNTASPEQLLRPLTGAVADYERDLAVADSPWLDGSGLFRLHLFNDSVRLNNVAASFFVDLAGAPDRLGAGPLRRIPEARANERWENCVRHSHAFARARGLPIYFFVQPNQHVAGSKPFTPEETACCLALPPGTPAGVQRSYDGITARYADFDARAARLRAEGIQAHTLTGVFRSTRETLYIDWCCHVNEVGDRIMADAIFDTITAPTAPATPEAP